MALYGTLIIKYARVVNSSQSQKLACFHANFCRGWFSLTPNGNTYLPTQPHPFPIPIHPYSLLNPLPHSYPSLSYPSAQNPAQIWCVERKQAYFISSPSQPYPQGLVDRQLTPRGVTYIPTHLKGVTFLPTPVPPDAIHICLLPFLPYLLLLTLPLPIPPTSSEFSTNILCREHTSHIYELFLSSPTSRGWLISGVALAYPPYWVTRLLTPRGGIYPPIPIPTSMPSSLLPILPPFQNVA